MSVSPKTSRAQEEGPTLEALQTLREGVGIALDALRANKIRSALTIMGVAVGVSVVVTMAAFITGIRTEVLVAFENAGTKNFIVTRFDFTAVREAEGGRPPWWDKPELTPREAARIASLPAIDEALYMIDANVNVSFEGIRVPSVLVRGSSPGWPMYQLGDFSVGRDFTDLEVQHARPVAVFSPGLTEELFGLRDPIGKRVRVSAPRRGVLEDFTVIGVFAPEENVFSPLVPHWAIIPYSASLKRLKASDEEAGIYVVPFQDSGPLEAQDQVISAMRSQRGLRPIEENNFALLASQQLVDLFNRLTGVFFLVMFGLSSTALMVGGVGVIGIMLISVTERTREIGVRKALGATRREILWQFLVEAAFLTVIGGAVGMGLGAGTAFAVAHFTPIPARIPLWSVAAALGMAMLTGMVFGLLPAYRAAHLDPVAALRAE